MRLSYEQLLLFCSVRSLPTTGLSTELASHLAHYDLHMYPFPSPKSNGPTHDGLAVTHSPYPSTTPNAASNAGPTTSEKTSVRSDSTSVQTRPANSPPRSRARIPQLPVEIIADIMDNVGDWELSKAVGLPTSLSQPLPWTRATSTDYALLTGYLPLLVSNDPAIHPPTSIGASLTVRFAYTHVIAFIFHHHRALFRRLYRNDLIPIVAAHNGRVKVLDWWLSMHREYPDDIPIPSRKAISDAIDGASKNGQVVSLDWWLKSGLPFEYTEGALENASAKNRIDVLEWWHAQKGSLPLKVGRVMDTASAAGAVDALEWWASSGLDYTYDRFALQHASCHGRVDVLQWWLNSGMQLFFDQDTLVGATKHNRPEVLEWWDKSGLPIQYRMCDVEEALEDAIGGGERAREWWRKKGVDFNANDKEWMKLQNLNS
ncbi:hypothetical protein OF83DRAFT_590776 [Amylostereum chailletii]|nr:hypothetical protein OF83DRAFT_590776 [Amylostereum chailletii]